MLPTTERPATGFGDEDGEVLAVPGDVILCTNGHPVFNVVEPVIAGSIAKSEWVRDFFTGEKPADGVAPLCSCDAPVATPIEGRPGRYMLYKAPGSRFP